MTVAQALVSWTAAAALMTIAPGLDTALVLRTAAVSGPKPALLAGTGICAGGLAWAVIVSVGLGGLLRVSHTLYDVLRIAGGGYLLVLAYQLLVHQEGSRRSAPCQNADTAGVGTRESPGQWLVRGFLTDILNPKVGVFYVSFLPLFVPDSVGVVRLSILLGVIHASESLVWYALLILATRAISNWLRRPRVARSINQATGAVLIAFGLKLLVDADR